MGLYGKTLPFQVNLKGRKSCELMRTAIPLPTVAWSKSGATHYYAQLGLPDGSRANKELIVCT